MDRATFSEVRHESRDLGEVRDGWGDPSVRFGTGRGTLKEV